jgi:hypothetical protein
VVLLGTTQERVLVGGYLPVGLLNLWCPIVAEVIGGFHRLVVGDIGDVKLAYVA